MNFEFFKKLFDSENTVKYKKPQNFEVGDIVEIIEDFRIQGLNILPGDSYPIIKMSQDGRKAKLEHGFGSKYDIFLETSKMKVVNPINKAKVNEQNNYKKVKP